MRGDLAHVVVEFKAATIEVDRAKDDFGRKGREDRAKGCFEERLVEGAELRVPAVEGAACGELDDILDVLLPAVRLYGHVGRDRDDGFGAMVV